MYKDNTDSSALHTIDIADQNDEIKETVTKNKLSDKDKIKSFSENMPAIVCFSHLRWDFVYQRPQHLLSRFANFGLLFYIEEPIFETREEPILHISSRGDNLRIVVPLLPHGLDTEQVESIQQQLIDAYIMEQKVEAPIVWYYTPMALSFSRHLKPVLTVYDCMDELAAFKFAPPRLKELEQELFRKADIVFTGGRTLYEAKQKQHHNVHAFPSSIDKEHFGKAKANLPEPEDQANIAHPKLGFFGVIDERMDLDLIASLADAKPEWQIVLLGPVVKIDPATLPQRKNLHFLGNKTYDELPFYLSNWQVALLPFAINESTAFISPTKTPEYLAAAKPVVSTPIKDVIRPYGEAGLVHIAATAPEFVDAIKAAMVQQEDNSWKKEVEAFMSNMSWEQTWKEMVLQMLKAIEAKDQSF